MIESLQRKFKWFKIIMTISTIIGLFIVLGILFRFVLAILFSKLFWLALIIGFLVYVITKSKK
ncbi:hypothetical protein PBI_PBS1_238 [Bacillus phage PBS1]|uniref:Uncharacterized protein n=1 Tax=Bacillus phage PBS1 TaxID=2884423 RepID=A0A223LCE5_BPPB1|nr:hypothetical protein FK780_gp209 [Bacillus phage PBS1]ASU00060.1 hypothetical protein PBI_PBS1_238 [Bacillus phage PBS1]QXN70265.1 hypothetical protein INTERNEXUS_225 [Bacillus phage vB_BspM_Internexus]BDE75430.1 hypothetical protein [Bacillus phage PBS1]